MSSAGCGSWGWRPESTCRMATRLRLARLVSVIDGGPILNQKTARSQIIGAAVNAIGMTMLEETVFAPGTGRTSKATFGDCLVPATADAPDLDAGFAGEP